MTTKTDIWNMALAYLGQPSLNEGDDNDRARKCKLFYQNAKETALRSHDWTFARFAAPLSKLDAPNAPGRVYAYPAGAVKILAVLAGANEGSGRFGRDPGLVCGPKTPWKTMLGPNGNRIIVCRAENAWAVYTASTVDESLFDPCFTEYLAWNLARRLCMTLTGDEKLLALCERGELAALDAARYANVNDEKHMARPKCSYLK